MKRLLNSQEDIEMLVNTFYNKVREDSLIGPIFNETAHVNWDEHIPKLINFWQDLLLGTDNYRGRPFPPHMRLNLEPMHFKRWLELFFETVNENFEGLKADEAKARALRIAQNFMINLGIN